MITDEEILKEIQEEQIRMWRITHLDKDGNRIPRGNYSDWVKAMKGENKCPEN
jgi:hypothetical protein